MTVAHTLEVAHGLFDHLKVVMDGAHFCSGGYQTLDDMCSNRRQDNEDIDRGNTRSST
jgi:hypothetical protein